jgi:hypothetical protein
MAEQSQHCRLGQRQLFQRMRIACASRHHIEIHYGAIEQTGLDRQRAIELQGAVGGAQLVLRSADIEGDAIALQHGQRTIATWKD